MQHCKIQNLWSNSGVGEELNNWQIPKYQFQWKTTDNADVYNGNVQISIGLGARLCFFWYIKGNANYYWKWLNDLKLVEWHIMVMAGQIYNVIWSWRTKSMCFNAGKNFGPHVGPRRAGMATGLGAWEGNAAKKGLGLMDVQLRWSCCFHVVAKASPKCRKRGATSGNTDVILHLYIAAVTQMLEHYVQFWLSCIYKKMLKNWRRCRKWARKNIRRLEKKNLHSVRPKDLIKKSKKR